jgi:hypothetical protein
MSARCRTPRRWFHTCDRDATIQRGRVEAKAALAAIEDATLPIGQVECDGYDCVVCTPMEAEIHLAACDRDAAGLAVGGEAEWAWREWLWFGEVAA